MMNWKDKFNCFCSPAVFSGWRLSLRPLQWPEHCRTHLRGATVFLLFGARMLSRITHPPPGSSAWTNPPPSRSNYHICCLKKLLFSYRLFDKLWDTKAEGPHEVVSGGSVPIPDLHLWYVYKYTTTRTRVMFTPNPIPRPRNKFLKNQKNHLHEMNRNQNQALSQAWSPPGVEPSHTLVAKQKNITSKHIHPRKPNI